MEKIKIFIITILAVMLTWTGVSYALQGELHCPVRSVPGILNSSVQISNFNRDDTTIKDILIFNMNGEELCAAPSDAWPFKDNPIFPTELKPYGGTWFSVKRIIDQGWCPKVNFDEERWLNIVIYWSSDEGYTPLYGRITEVPKDKKVTLGRSSLMCEILVYE